MWERHGKDELFALSRVPGAELEESLLDLENMLDVRDLFFLRDNDLIALHQGVFVPLCGGAELALPVEDLSRQVVDLLLQFLLISQRTLQRGLVGFRLVLPECLDVFVSHG